MKKPQKSLRDKLLSEEFPWAIMVLASGFIYVFMLVILLLIAMMCGTIFEEVHSVLIIVTEWMKNNPLDAAALLGAGYVALVFAMSIRLVKKM